MNSLFNMEEIYAACVTYEPSLFDYIDLKNVTEPIWILGRQYSVHEGDEFSELCEDIKSKLWFTYRKQFNPIGDTNLTSDAGWGCMHRCGQMLMAQALILRYLGRDWRWNPSDSNEMYEKIISLFNDNVESHYSIHKIAEKGGVMEKEIGQWFGPNTIVQVLKRLAEDDEENDISVHVAMDNMVIKQDIRKYFKRKNENGAAASCSYDFSNKCSLEHKETYEVNKDNTVSQEICPVLLTIPLRLGLSEINPVYFEKLKAVFKVKQTLGIIGGRTNHASYFIGYVGNDLIFLDPHTTQIHRKDSPMEDKTYHCENPSRMSFSHLDPSVALCFYLRNEADFEQWCTEAQHDLLEPERDAMFEILEEKPPMLPYLDIEGVDDFNFPLTEQERVYTSDEEYELLM